MGPHSYQGERDNKNGPPYGEPYLIQLLVYYILKYTWIWLLFYQYIDLFVPTRKF